MYSCSYEKRPLSLIRRRELCARCLYRWPTKEHFHDDVTCPAESSTVRRRTSRTQLLNTNYRCPNMIKVWKRTLAGRRLREHLRICRANSGKRCDSVFSRVTRSKRSPCTWVCPTGMYAITTIGLLPNCENMHAGNRSFKTK